MYALSVSYGCVWKPAIKVVMSPVFSTAQQRKGMGVQKLPTKNVLPYAEISLFGCNTSAGRNIAKSFANHFGVPTLGSQKKNLTLTMALLIPHGIEEVVHLL